MLGCLLGRPTALSVAGEPHLCRPLTIGGIGTLLRNGADALGMDGDAGNVPEFSDPAFRAWLVGEGAPLLLWESLRADLPSLTFAECVRLAAAARDGEIEDVYDAASRRADVPARAGRGSGDWPSAIYSYFEAGHLPEAFASLALDQALLIATQGKGFDRTDEITEATIAEAQERWEAMRVARPKTVADELEELGLEIVPEAQGPGSDVERGGADV